MFHVKPADRLGPKTMLHCIKGGSTWNARRKYAIIQPTTCTTRIRCKYLIHMML